MEGNNDPSDFSSSSPATASLPIVDIIISPSQPLTNAVGTMITSRKPQLEKAIRENCPGDLNLLLHSEPELLKLLIEEEFSEDNGPKTLSLAPLALAAALDHVPVLDALLDHDANVHEQIGGIRGTSLHLAARFGSKDSVHRLVSKGADVNQQDLKGCSPLHLASRYGKLEIVVYLLDVAAKIDCLDFGGYMPFHLAIMGGHLEISKHLFQRGSVVHINKVNKFSYPPLHLAIRHNGHNLVEWLLNSGADIEQTGGKLQNSPLAEASMLGHTEIVQLLIQREADIHRRNKQSNTPVLLACLFEQLETLLVLIACGASLSDVDLRGNSCFHHIVESQGSEWHTTNKIIGNLVGLGANINQLTYDGISPLRLACLRKKHEYVEMLITWGADVNYISPMDGNMALMVTCALSDCRTVEILLQKDPDLTITNHHGMTALMLACHYGLLHNVQALIHKGAKVMIYDKQGYSPLRAALSFGYHKIAFELLATEEYYPRYLTANIHSGGRIDDTPSIENALLTNFKNTQSGGTQSADAQSDDTQFRSLTTLYVLMYWAVSRGALTLAQKCIDRDEQLLQWNREGNTWFHVAANSGSLEIIGLLFRYVATKPEQTAEWAEAEAILRRNDRGESALTISIHRGHTEIQDLFWNGIWKLRDTSTRFVEMYPAVADWLLELLALYEKPGHETILMEFLQHWYGKDTRFSELGTALHWAVHRRKVVVVWWLLSKGGYNSGGAIESAKKLVPKDCNENDICHDIHNLLVKPPPLLNHIPNPNKEHIFTTKAGTDELDVHALDSQGNIIHIVTDGYAIKIPYNQPTVRDIIYGLGPKALMKSAKNDLRLHDLNALRNASKRAVPPQNQDSHRPAPAWASSISSRRDAHDKNEFTGTSGELLLRWIHLPVNELHLMRDLVSRLSSDAERSEMSYMALMKHFNQSWSELAAGGGHYYMKPQTVVCLYRYDEFGTMVYHSRTNSKSRQEKAILQARPKLTAPKSRVMGIA
ncbi:ankyrin repeat-containing domain protein [Xylaria arbuscula]|nr:ankyrin repeat-containing domain protein [Xylaria arbuscula]